MDKQSVLVINLRHFHWLSLSGLLGHFNTFSISKSCRVGKLGCMAPVWPRGVWGGVRCVCMREQSLILIWATATACISCPPQTASCPWCRSIHCPPSDTHTQTPPPTHTRTHSHMHTQTVARRVFLGNYTIALAPECCFLHESSGSCICVSTTHTYIQHIQSLVVK